MLLFTVLNCDFENKLFLFKLNVWSLTIILLKSWGYRTYYNSPNLGIHLTNYVFAHDTHTYTYIDIFMFCWFMYPYVIHFSLIYVVYWCPKQDSYLFSTNRRYLYIFTGYIYIFRWSKHIFCYCRLFIITPKSILFFPDCITYHNKTENPHAFTLHCVIK